MSKPRGSPLLIAVLLGFAVPVLCGAQRPLGPPFQVNVESAGLQAPASLAMNARGEFVVAWVNVPVDGAEPRTIIARKFAAGGMPRTDEIQVAEFPADNHPAEVVIREDGSFFVVLAYPDLVARRYGPDGDFVGGERGGTWPPAQQLHRRRSSGRGVRPGLDARAAWAGRPGRRCLRRAGRAGAPPRPGGPTRGRGAGTGDRGGAGRRFRGGLGRRAGHAGDAHFFDLYVLAQRFGAGGKPLEGGSPSRSGSRRHWRFFVRGGRGWQLPPPLAGGR